MDPSAYPGELSALAAAMLWSATSIPFTYVAKRIGATAVNTFKTVLASVILIVVVCVTEGPEGLLLDHPLAYVYLGLGGVIGLSICDSLLFRSYALIGPRIAFLVFATSPFFAALLRPRLHLLINERR